MGRQLRLCRRWEDFLLLARKHRARGDGGVRVGASEERAGVDGARCGYEGGGRPGKRQTRSTAWSPGRGKPRPYISGKRNCSTFFSTNLYRMLLSQVHVLR